MDIFLSITLNDFTDCLFGYGDSIAAIYSPVETRTYLLRLIRAFAFRHVLLLECFAFGSRLSLQFCCNVLPSVHACCLTLSAKQDGLRYLAFLFRAGRDRHSCVLAALFGYLPLWVHFGIVRLFVAISTGLPGTLGYGAGGAAFVRLCAIILALQCFPRGVRWGSAPQTCAKESSTLWTLFTLRRGYVDTNTHPCKKRKRPNQRTHACKTRVHG